MLSDFFLAGMRSSLHCIWFPLSSFHRNALTKAMTYTTRSYLTVLALVDVSEQFEKMIALSFLSLSF